MSSNMLSDAVIIKEAERLGMRPVLIKHSFDPLIGPYESLDDQNTGMLMHFFEKDRLLSLDDFFKTIRTRAELDHNILDHDNTFTEMDKLNMFKDFEEIIVKKMHLKHMMY